MLQTCCSGQPNDGGQSPLGDGSRAGRVQRRRAQSEGAGRRPRVGDAEGASRQTGQGDDRATTGQGRQRQERTGRPQDDDRTGHRKPSSSVVSSELEAFAKGFARIDRIALIDTAQPHPAIMLEAWVDVMVAFGLHLAGNRGIKKGPSSVDRLSAR